MVGSLAVALVAGAACHPLPAGFADDVRVRDDRRQGARSEHSETVLCLRAGGRRVVLRRAYAALPYRGGPRGTVIAAAAAAGHGFGNGDAVSVAGLDRHWVLIERRHFTRYDTCVEYRQRPVDARSGRRGPVTSTRRCSEGSTPASPHRRLAVTTRESLVEWTNNGAPRSMELP